MPTELALLTRQAVTADVIDDQAQRLFPGGLLLAHDASGVFQYVDPAGRPVVSVFASGAIGAHAHVDALVVGGTSGLEWWTEVTVPYGDATSGVRLARAIAVACGGRIAERK